MPVSAPRAIASAVLSALVLSGMASTASALPSEQPGTPAVKSEKNDRYLVRYDSGTNVAAEAREMNSDGVKVHQKFSHAVRAAAVTASPAEVAALESDPQVAAVEIDAPVHAFATQDPAPWGLDRTDQQALPLSGSYSPSASGAGVNAYVLDSGVRASHKDFGGRVAAGWTAINDGRGTADCNGHGTHVAGTIGGSTFGMAKKVTIIPVRVLGCQGTGLMSGTIAGLDWIAAHHDAGAPAVVNVSLGGPASSTVDAALQGVINDGVAVAVAAGNDSADACSQSPGRAPAALTVAASGTADQQAGFSNDGSCIDLHAPGKDITSALETSDTATGTMSGTSMASPHVAGAAAILLSQDPFLTPAEITAALKGNATAGVVSSTGPGTPNRLLYLPTASEPAASAEISRIAGRTLYDTSAAISTANFAPGVPTVYIARGDRFPDALAGGPGAKAGGGPLLLVKPTSIPAAIEAELKRLQPQRIVVLGGPVAVDDSVLAQLSGLTTGGVTRLAGSNLYDTAAAISRATQAENIDKVYIATGENFPDALAGAAPAARDGYPILLVKENSLPDATATELNRLNPREIVVLGGPAAVGDAVYNELKPYAGAISRIGGRTLYATAALISQQHYAPDVDRVYVTTGMNFPDALSGVPVAGMQGAPILLVPTGGVPSSVATELRRLQPGSLTILGGEVAVPAEVEQQLRAVLDGSS